MCPILFQFIIFHKSVIMLGLFSDTVFITIIELKMNQIKSKLIDLKVGLFSSVYKEIEHATGGKTYSILVWNVFFRSVYMHATTTLQPNKVAFHLKDNVFLTGDNGMEWMLPQSFFGTILFLSGWVSINTKTHEMQSKYTKVTLFSRNVRRIAHSG